MNRRWGGQAGWAMTEQETERNPVMIGSPPRSRRQAMVKSLWIVIWFLYLSGPVGQLIDGELSARGEALGWTGLSVFIAVYFRVVFRHMVHAPLRGWVVRAMVAFLAALAGLLSWSLGPNWLVLFTFVC